MLWRQATGLLFLKNKKKIILLFLVVLLSSCTAKNVLKLSEEDLENCLKWNWIALSDISLWTPKGEAYFTYVPNIANNEFRNLNRYELILFGTWQSIYNSSYFHNITVSYKDQYENSNIFENIYFCRDASGYLENRILLESINELIKYRFKFNWKIENGNIYVKPILIAELDIANNDIIESYEFSDESYYKIGSLAIDNKYLIQLTNWDFRDIPMNDTFMNKKYGIANLGIDCLRYKYTWIEDWGVPILEEFAMYNKQYNLNELKSMKLYR